MKKFFILNILFLSGCTIFNPKYSLAPTKSSKNELGWTDHCYLLKSFSAPNEYVFTRFPNTNNLTLIREDSYVEIHSFYKTFVLNIARSKGVAILSEKDVSLALGDNVLDAVKNDKKKYGFTNEVYFVPAVLFRSKTPPEYYLYRNNTDELIVFSVAPKNSQGDIIPDYSLIMVHNKNLSKVNEYLIPPNIIFPEKE